MDELQELAQVMDNSFVLRASLKREGLQALFHESKLQVQILPTWRQEPVKTAHGNNLLFHTKIIIDSTLMSIRSLEYLYKGRGPSDIPLSECKVKT